MGFEPMLWVLQTLVYHLATSPQRKLCAILAVCAQENGFLRWNCNKHQSTVRCWVK